MKNWKHCLPPLFTALAVLVLALLPPRLSSLEDRSLSGAVHTEDLAEDSNFPSKPPDLPGRVRLLVQWQYSPGEVTIVQQELTEPAAQAEAEAQIRAALAELTEAGVLPSGQPDFPEGFTASRLYLRNQEDLSSASFLLAESRDQITYSLSIILDLETGLALSIRLVGPDVMMEDFTPHEQGRQFLDRLGLEYEALGGSDLYGFGFRLPECRSVFLSYVCRYMVKYSLEPGLDTMNGPNTAVSPPGTYDSDVSVSYK